MAKIKPAPFRDLMSLHLEPLESPCLWVPTIFFRMRRVWLATKEGNFCIETLSNQFIKICSFIKKTHMSKITNTYTIYVCMYTSKCKFEASLT